MTGMPPKVEVPRLAPNWRLIEETPKEFHEWLRGAARGRCILHEQRSLMPARSLFEHGRGTVDVRK
jgi:hypothetical protein